MSLKHLSVQKKPDFLKDIVPLSHGIPLRIWYTASHMAVDSARSFQTRYFGIYALPISAKT